MFWSWKITLLALIKIMINVSIENLVTDTENFTKKIVFFPPLPLSLRICAGDTREGEKRGNLV